MAPADPCDTDSRVTEIRWSQGWWLNTFRLQHCVTSSLSSAQRRKGKWRYLKVGSPAVSLQPLDVLQHQLDPGLVVGDTQASTVPGHQTFKCSDIMVKIMIPPIRRRSRRRQRQQWHLHHGITWAALSDRLLAGVGDVFFADGLVPHWQAAVHGNLGRGHCRHTHVDTWRLFICAAKQLWIKNLAAFLEVQKWQILNVRWWSLVFCKYCSV